MATPLNTYDDLLWLEDVHKIGMATQYAVAVIHGNEDSPTKVELFARNHYKCRPTVYTADETGVLRLTQLGQKPQPRFIEDRQ